MARPEKITFGEMRESGVLGVIVFCGDYRCSHSTTPPSSSRSARHRPFAVVDTVIDLCSEICSVWCATTLSAGYRVTKGVSISNGHHPTIAEAIVGTILDDGTLAAESISLRYDFLLVAVTIGSLREASLVAETIGLRHGDRVGRSGSSKREGDCQRGSNNC